MSVKPLCIALLTMLAVLRRVRQLTRCFDRNRGSSLPSSACKSCTRFIALAVRT